MNAPSLAARLDALTVRAGEHTLLDRVSIRVPSRGITAIIGPNGAGKSTLLSVLLGLREPTEGRAAIVLAHEQESSPARAPRGWISAVLQDEGAFDGMTASEYAALFGALFSDRALAARALAQCGLAERAHTRLDRLSGGELRRLQLAVSLASDPRLLVLDEPTNHLDPAARRALLATLREAARSRAVLVATHDLHEAARVADAVIVLVAGRVCAQGSLEALLDALPEPARRRGLEGLFAHHTGATLDALGQLDALDTIAAAPEEDRS